MGEIKRTPAGGYAQEWPAYDSSQVAEKRLFRTLLYELCLCVGEPKQVTGRPRLPLADMVFSVTFKVYSTFSARRFMTDLSEAQAKGLIRQVPHFNSVSRYLQADSLTAVLTRLIEISSLPLEPFETDFAVDATGFGTRQYARWVDERTAAERAKREWIKVHLICGVRTNVVAGVIVTPRRAADSPYFGRLVATAARNFKVEEVSADKGYFAAENMRHALVAGATPYIPFKSSCRLDQELKSNFWRRMLYMYRYRQQEFAAHYNKRNNVETTFSMIKAKFGDRVRSKSTRAQFNEALCKVLCHNLCVVIQSMYELGITPEFMAEAARLEPAPEVQVEPIAEGRIVAPATIKYDRPVEARSGKGRGRRKRRHNPDQLGLFREETQLIS